MRRIITAAGGIGAGGIATLHSVLPISLLLRKDNSQEMDWSKLTLADLIPEEEIQCDQSFIHVFDSNNPDDEFHVQATCSRPWCLRCEPVRVWRLQRKITKYLEYHNTEYKHLWLVTRSVRNTSEFRTSIDHLRAAQVAFTKQCSGTRSPDHPLRLAKFWIATTEVKYSGRSGYNVHEHMIWGVDSSWIPLKEFHVYWDRAAGFGGAHINVVKLNDIRHGSNYIAKYLSKGVWGGLASGRAYILREELKGRNRIQTKRGTIVKKPLGGAYQYCCSFIAASDCENETVMGTRKFEVVLEGSETAL